MKKLIFFSLIVIFCFSSCLVTTNGMAGSGPLLDVKDRPVAVAMGSSRAFSVIGFGGFRRDILIQEAKSYMFANRPLKEKEYYSNITTQINSKYILGGVVVIRRVVVSAEVMSQDPPEKSALTKVQQSPDPVAVTWFKTDGDTFHVGETIYANIGSTESEFFRLKVVAVNGNKATVKFLDWVKEDRNIRVSEYRFFGETRSLGGYLHNDKVLVTSLSTGSRKEGTVLGANSRYVLVATKGEVDYYPVARLEHMK